MALIRCKIRDIPLCTPNGMCADNLLTVMEKSMLKDTNREKNNFILFSMDGLLVCVCVCVCV